MRRTLAVLTLAAALALAAGCGLRSTPSAAPTFVSPSPSPSSSEDYTADTEKICDQFENDLKNDMRSFGEALGKMIAYKQAGNSTQAAKARATGQKELREYAAKVRSLTRAAQDPKVRKAGEESAKNIEATAANRKFFDRLKSLDDMEKTLKGEMAAWIVPLAFACT